MNAVALHAGSHEVISPELVLVDPELAQIARRRLPDPPEWCPPPPAARFPTARAHPVVEPPRDARRSTRALGAVATAIPLVLLGAVVVGMVASEVRAQLLDGPATLIDSSTPEATAPADLPGLGVPTKSEVEARTLVVLRQGVLLSVPSPLIDMRTGVLVNDVRVTCRRVGRSAQFSCKVGIGRYPARAWLLDVVGARDGGEWTWLGPAAAH